MFLQELRLENLHALAFHIMKYVNTSWQQTMGSGCCETINEFESVWVHACVSGVITRRQFCVLLYGCSSCWESFARKAHSETLTCISRYIYPFANALLGKFSRIDLHAFACPRNAHRNPLKNEGIRRGSARDPRGILSQQGGSVLFWTYDF